MKEIELFLGPLPVVLDLGVEEEGLLFASQTIVRKKQKLLMQ